MQCPGVVVKYSEKSCLIFCNTDAVYFLSNLKILILNNFKFKPHT